MAKKNTPQERFLEKLSCENSLENPFFNIEHFEITYYNTYRKTLDNEDIWEDKSSYKRINGNAIAVRILVEKDTMIAENDLSFTLKIADENRIVSKTMKPQEFHNYQNELLTMRFDTGKLNEGEYYLGTGCGNYLIQVSKIRIIDTGKKPLAMREIEETPELGDLKAFLQKQINVKYYAENNETNIPLNWNMAFMGNEGVGKERMAKLVENLLEELDIVTHTWTTLDGNELYNLEFEGAYKKIGDTSLHSKQILLIHNADALAERKSTKFDGVETGSYILEKIVDKVGNDSILILLGKKKGILEALTVSDKLGKLVPNRFEFPDMSNDVLLKIADKMLRKHYLYLSWEAVESFKTLITATRTAVGKHFKNGDWLEEVIEKEILPQMANRVVEHNLLDDKNKNSKILPEDIPQPKTSEKNSAYEKLDKMVGLNTLKNNIVKYLCQVNFNHRRREQGLYGKMGPLHMIFTGNPGTGKTTVAELMGEIFAGMGVLSSGHVVQTDRSKLIGAGYRNEAAVQTKYAIKRAQGGVLFIDEAYTLFRNDDQDSAGKNVIDTLMPVLSNDEADMIVILAGYPDEMKKLLNSNPGLQSRFPIIFHFADYSVSELMNIADVTAKELDFEFSPEAKIALEKNITAELRKREKSFGNARYVVRMLKSQIIPNMSMRLAKHDGTIDTTLLKTILSVDIPAPKKNKYIENLAFDEATIEYELQRLDNLIGLQRVKTAIHNFVKIARELNRQDKWQAEKMSLKWSFTGVSGTGKSTVAEIFAKILCAMHLLERGHLIEVKAEEIYGVPPFQAAERVREAMEKSRCGLLFIDGDDAQFRERFSGWNSEQMRMTLAGYTAGISGDHALIIAEYESPRQRFVRSIVDSGVADFDNTFIFDNYSAEELFLILAQMLQKEEMKMSENAEAVMRLYINEMYQSAQDDYANARTIRMLATTIAQNVRLRTLVEQQPDLTVVAEDVKSFVWKGLPAKYGRIGFTFPTHTASSAN